MNEKEVAEIRRRFRPDHSNIGAVRGCYVNEKREVVAEFKQSMTMTSREESEQILTLLKKSLSGTLGKNLAEIEFETQQVVSGEEHALLMALRKSGLEDDEAVRAFYTRVIEAANMEGNYLILLAHDNYDVPFRSRNGESEGRDSEEVFSYIVCSLCPIKLTKPQLGFHVAENRFCNIAADWVVSPPELGFLFPAFDERATNIYSALYYTKDLAENHEEFVDAVFKCPAPMPAAAQRETFGAVLSESVAESCSFEVVNAVHEQMSGMIADHRENKDLEPLRVSKTQVRELLETCGVPDERVESFDTRFDEEFGEGTELSPAALVGGKQLEITTPDVTIRVNPERADLVKTEVIDGRHYILIRAEEGVEVNGVPIAIGSAQT